MRLALSIALASIVIPQSMTAQSRPSESDRPAPTQRTFEGIYQRFLDGIRLRDTLRYRDMLTADYVYVGDDGSRVVKGRAARLAMDLSSHDRWQVFAVERCELVIRPEVAAGPCWYRAKGESDGQSGEWRGVSVVTFVREDSHWRIAATRPSVLSSRP